MGEFEKQSVPFCWRRGGICSIVSFHASWDVSHLLWGLDVTATKVVVQSGSHRTASFSCGCEHVEFKGYFSRHTNLNINWNI